MSASNVMKFPEIQRYDCNTAEQFTSCKLPKGVPDSIKGIREEAFARFKQQGLPTQKLERFKYTNIAKVAAQWDGVLADLDVKVENGGAYVSNLLDSLDVPVVSESLAMCAPGADKYGDMSLWDLNTAYLRDGLFVDIPVNENVDTPIVLNFDNIDDTYTSARYVIRIGRNAEATIVEKYSGKAECWKNYVTQIILEDNAKLNHIRIIEDSDLTVYSQNTSVKLGRDAAYEGFSLNMGEGILRHQIHAELDGPNGNASFNGLNLLKNKAHADTTITMDHKVHHCNSNQFYRSLVDDEAHGIFQGKVHVFEDAQVTDGYQLSNTILLSPKASMDTKPELEIYADDVKCSHGATTGQLDEEPLFYLRSRGLSEKQARYLLIRAFVEEVLEKIGNENLRDELAAKTDRWLEAVL